MSIEMKIKEEVTAESSFYQLVLAKGERRGEAPNSPATPPMP